MDEESFYKLHVTDVNPPRPLFRDTSSNDVEVATSKLWDALRTFGNNERPVMKLLISLSSQQRQEVSSIYKVMFGRYINQDIDVDDFHFQDLLRGLLMPPTEYIANCLYNAILAEPLDVETIVQIICVSSNEEVHQIQRSYEKLFGSDLTDDLDRYTSGSFFQLLKMLLKGSRDPSSKAVDEELAVQEATQLYASVSSWLSNTKSWNQLISQRNFSQIRETFAQYFKVSGYEVVRTLAEEFKENLLLAYNVILRATNRPASHLAKCLAKALNEGDFRTVTRIIIWRAEIDLADIIEEYPRVSTSHLVYAVVRSCKGSYRRAVRAIVEMA